MGKWYLKLRAQMLRGATSRVGPLALRLREGARFFQEDPTCYGWGGGGLANDTTPVITW